MFLFTGRKNSLKKSFFFNLKSSREKKFNQITFLCVGKKNLKKRKRGTELTLGFTSHFDLNVGGDEAHFSGRWFKFSFPLNIFFFFWKDQLMKLLKRKVERNEIFVNGISR